MIFNKGFPENRIEFNNYFADTTKTSLRGAIRELRDIRHHDLTRLLQYSGEKYNIQTNFSSEWSTTTIWNPEMRYAKTVIRKAKCEIFFNSVKRIINDII